MEIKNNLLIKDLRFYSWFLRLHYSLKNLLPFPMQIEDYLNFRFLLKQKGLSVLQGIPVAERCGVNDIWSQHFNLLLRFDASIHNGNFSDLWSNTFIVKNGLLRPQITEMRDTHYKDVKTGEIEIVEESFYIEKGGLYFLQTFLYETLQFWFTFPSFINDLYKFSKENNQSTEIEEIFFKAWLELPLVIDELYNYLRNFTKDTGFKLHNAFETDLGKACSFDKLKEFPGFLILNAFCLMPSLTDAKEEDLTPFTKEFLKVCPKIPFHLKEYLYFFKLSLKDKEYSSNFASFFLLLSKIIEEPLLVNTKISNESWKLLMYNTPYPLRVINEIQEARNERSKKAALGEKVFGQDQPGGLMFHLHNLSKALAEKNTGKK